MGPLNIYNNEHSLNTYITDIIPGIGSMSCPCRAYNLLGKTESMYVLFVTVEGILLSNLIRFVIFQCNNNGVKLETNSRKISKIFHKLEN